jgi:glycosyltransferase involved in cell wall biosynthesis
LERRLRIGLVLPGFSASESDWCIPALLDLVRILSSTPGVEVEVFPLRYPDRRTPYRVYSAIVHPQGGIRAHRSGRVVLWSRALRAIVRAHRRAPFDLLHAFWADEPGLVAVMAAKLLRIPAVVSLAGGELVGFPDIGYGGQLHRSSRWITRSTLRYATLVTAGSDFLAQIAAKHVGTDRLAVLPLGVDTALFGRGSAKADPSPYQVTPPDALNILHVASLVPIKDQRTLLRATARLVEAEPNAHLHLAGEGPLLGTLQAEANRLGIPDHVHFIGPVAHDALPDLYRAADFCVLTSVHEAEAMVVLEAAAVGRLTVGTAVGLLPDLCPEGAVPVGDVANLARVMIEMARNPEMRWQAGARALRVVEKDYALNQTVGRLLQCYGSLSERGA